MFILFFSQKEILDLVKKQKRKQEKLKTVDHHKLQNSQIRCQKLVRMPEILQENAESLGQILQPTLFLLTDPASTVALRTNQNHSNLALVKNTFSLCLDIVYFRAFFRVSQGIMPGIIYIQNTYYIHQYILQNGTEIRKQNTKVYIGPELLVMTVSLSLILSSSFFCAIKNKKPIIQQKYDRGHSNHE